MMILKPISVEDMARQLRIFFDKEENRFPGRKEQQEPRDAKHVFPHMSAYSTTKKDWMLFTTQQLVEELNRILKEGKESCIQDLWGFGVDRIIIKAWVYRPITEQRQIMRPTPIITFRCVLINDPKLNKNFEFLMSAISAEEMEDMLRKQFTKGDPNYTFNSMSIMSASNKEVYFTMKGFVEEIDRILKDGTRVGDDATLWGLGTNKVTVYWTWKP
jgi:hypothetical protein